jgi:TnpA family transposase
VAALMAWGTNMGLGKMAQNSDISYTALSQISDHFIRLETLATANDRIANATAGLPLFRFYDMQPVEYQDTQLHSSSDGQKFETRLHTFKARHSPKYFGLKKGVVAYTLIANHVPVNAELIGAHDHESHYVFDLLFNNTTEIDPDIHSTDTDGTNHVNFALLHLFGYQFAPRYKDLYDKVSTSLYGFNHPKHYDDTMLLKPIRKINTQLIIEEWENIERILVSLALKTTRQSIIISKLSAHVRKNRTKRALWEYDHIIQSLYLLDYIDLPPLRRNVHRALNRGENYHQLRRAVSHANFGKLRFKTEYEQKLWSESSRLITNCIIYYNMALLSALWTQKKQGMEEDAALLTQISPVAWQHINLGGRYEFGLSAEPINLEAIVDRIARMPLADLKT